MKKFWSFRKIRNEDGAERILTLNGTIAEESWFDDDITPEMFKDELLSDSGDLTVWINSPGGDCIAAARIYNLLYSYTNKVTVKIDGIAASAASVVAMAGDEVLMSPVSMIMIHNPMTLTFGDHIEMKRAADMLNEVKESIMNAYLNKTGQSKAKLSHLMDNETWMNAEKAVELGFADGIFERYLKEEPRTEENTVSSFLFERKRAENILLNKLDVRREKGRPPDSAEKENLKTDIQNIGSAGHSANEIISKLEMLGRCI